GRLHELEERTERARLRVAQAVGVHTIDHDDVACADLDVGTVIYLHDARTAGDDVKRKFRMSVGANSPRTRDFAVHEDRAFEAERLQNVGKYVHLLVWSLGQKWWTE